MKSYKQGFFIWGFRWGEYIALLVIVSPPACVWPCEAACRKEEEEIRQSQMDILGGPLPWWMVDFSARKLRSWALGSYSFFIFSVYQFL